ncbi:MAG TPA: hypothetical protein PKZ84_11535 [Anaerolineae bacterium]|nr:hypothetical protein [Anaerolineae bacterium]
MSVGHRQPAVVEDTRLLVAPAPQRAWAVRLAARQADTRRTLSVARLVVAHRVVVAQELAPALGRAARPALPGATRARIVDKNGRRVWLSRRTKRK